MKHLLIVSLLFLAIGSSRSHALDFGSPGHSTPGLISASEHNRSLIEKQWNSGSQNCRTNDEPLIEVFSFSSSTYVLRQNKCVSFEAPFIYVLFGEHTVLVHDTGATESSEKFPLADAVLELVNARSKLGYPDIQTILVTHSHSHGDHTSADLQFRSLDSVKLIEPNSEAILKYFGITDWPNESAKIDLGGRELTIIPTPGHQEESISIYDPQTKWMLTGDTFYPGNVYVKNWQAYRLSIRRLVDFSKIHQVSMLMGSHIEMSIKPGKAYPIGTTYQPHETTLPLQLEDLYQLHAALEASGAEAKSLTFDHLLITPMNVVQKAIGSVLKWFSQ
tara:strand:- start:4775 stop:5773 length:999 start_codon:yes stop_codon:yes gene_type:complete